MTVKQLHDLLEQLDGNLEVVVLMNIHYAEDEAQPARELVIGTYDPELNEFQETDDCKPNAICLA